FDPAPTSEPCLGFADSRYFPPAGLDPDLAALADGAPDASSYAFALLRPQRLTPSLRLAIETLGGRVIGLHAPAVVKLSGRHRAPTPSPAAIAALPSVYWLGRARAGQNPERVLGARFRRAEPSEPIALAVSLFETDPDASIEPIEIAAGTRADAGPGEAAS